jgi:hypothetical protein
MPNLPLPRFLETHETRLQHARQLERTVRQAAGNVSTASTAARTSHTAADSKTLRGIPAIGRGVAGVIPGMRPDAIADRDE